MTNPTVYFPVPMYIQSNVIAHRLTCTRSWSTSINTQLFCLSCICCQVCSTMRCKQKIRLMNQTCNDNVRLLSFGDNYVFLLSIILANYCSLYTFTLLTYYYVTTSSETKYYYIQSMFIRQCDSQYNIKS